MGRDRVLALDLGTTGVRALVVASDGAVLSRTYRPLRTSYPEPGRVEQDPREMWERSVEVMRAAMSEAGTRASDVAGVGLVTQRATVVAWDAASGEPLAPAIGWQDRRTAERVQWFRERGIPLNAQASATKLEWWLQNEPAVQKAARSGGLRFGTPDAWLTCKLTGGEAWVTDPGHASCTALFDLSADTWSAPLLALFGIDEKTLPAVVATAGVVGETPRKLLGGPVPVAARAGDQQAAAFAQGAHARGQAKLTLGTSAMLDLNAGPEPIDAPEGTYPLALWRLSDGTRAYCFEATMLTAGSAVEWLVGLGLAPDAAAVDRMAREAGSSRGVSFVPALQGLGTPLFDPGATGMIRGITPGTGAPEIARALLEGIAHRCVDLADALALGEGPLAVDGGLARSDVLLQALADFGGREMLRAAETETTALGAAFLAGLATSVWEEPGACLGALPAPARFRPSNAEDERAALRARWRAAVERARGE